MLRRRPAREAPWARRRPGTSIQEIRIGLYIDGVSCMSFAKSHHFLLVVDELVQTHGWIAQVDETPPPMLYGVALFQYLPTFPTDEAPYAE